MSISLLKKIIETARQKKEKPENERLQKFKEEKVITIYNNDLIDDFSKTGSEELKIPVGRCKRQLLFEFLEVPKTNDLSTEVEKIIELNQTLKNETIERLVKTKAINSEQTFVEYEVPLENSKVLLKGSHTLVLDNGTTVEYFPFKGGDWRLKQGPFTAHLPLLVVNLAISFLKNPDQEAKLIAWYQNKNSLEDHFLELTFDGSKDGYAYFEGKPLTDFNFFKGLENIYKLEKTIEKTQIPARDYGYLTKKQAQFMFENKELNKEAYAHVMQEGKQLFFNCTNCAFQALCLEND